MNWLLVVLGILVVLFFIIITYRCRRELPPVPPRPPHENYKAPDPVFNDIEQEYCDDADSVTLVWRCDFSTSIYRPDNIGFRLSTDFTDTGDDPENYPIDNNIIPGENLTHKVVNGCGNAPYGACVEYSFVIDRILYPKFQRGNYYMRLKSYARVPEQGKSIPHTFSNEGNQTVLVYQTILKDVENLRPGMAVYYSTAAVKVLWSAADQDYPFTDGVSYDLCLLSGGECINLTSGASSVVKDITGLEYTYAAGEVPVGDLQIRVQTKNQKCCVNGDCPLSEGTMAPVTIAIESLPKPSLIQSNYCNYQDIEINWNMDFSSSGYDPNKDDIRYSLYTSYVDHGSPGDACYQVAGPLFDRESMIPSNEGDSDFTYVDNGGGSYTYTYTMKNDGTPWQLGIFSVYVEGIIPDNPDVTSISNTVTDKMMFWQGEGPLATNVATDKSAYINGEMISCSWEDPDVTCPELSKYTYNVCLTQGAGGVCLEKTQCSNFTGRNMYYQIDQSASSATGGCVNDKNSTSNPRNLNVPKNTYRFAVRSRVNCSGRSVRGPWSFSAPFTVS